MVRLNALGQSSIEVGDVRIGPEQPHLFAIALYLIIERGKKIPRQAIVDLIWPEVKDEKHARQRLRQALLRLREFGIPIIGESGTLLLEKSAVETDYALLATPDAVCSGQSLEFLPHYLPRISDRFQDWVDTQRSRVHADVQRIFLVRMQQARNRGDWGEVDAVATECLRLDSFNEEAVMAHAECAAMRGSKRDALTILDSYMESLGGHVGTIGLPAKILRTRIAERLTDQRYAMISEQHFVGRDASMELLLGLLREAQRSSGSAAYIWGEPGIGKSRLVQEVTQVAALAGARIVSTKCHPTDAGRPLSAFADLVPILKTLPGALGCSAQTLSLLQRLTDRNKSDAYPAQEAGDAAFLAAIIRRAVFDLVDAVADEGMLVMVIEDVHWLDGPSWAILSAMVEWATTRTLLVLMTSRTAHATEIKVADPDRGFHRHHLLPLADADSGTLLDKLTKDDADALPERVRDWSVATAEGNPFFLRELVRHWVETQQSFGVPRSLADLIEARLNRLSSLALRVLQLCASLGKHSNFERLEKATGYANHTLLDAIEELSTAAMLAPVAVGLVVKHDLLATAVTARLGDAAARLVHRQVASVLEAEINEKHTAALMWDCAEHWQRAGDTAHALATVRLCAEHLHSVGQMHEAIDLHRKALPICPGPEDRLITLLAIGTGLKAIGGWSRLDEVLGEAQRVSQATGNDGGVADYLHLLRLETGWRLRAELESSAPVFLEFALDTAKCAVHRLQAAHLGMIMCADEGLEDEAKILIDIVDNLPSEAYLSALVAHTKMIFHVEFGDLDKAVEHAHTLLALETNSGEPGTRCRAQLNVAYCYRIAGLITHAKKLLHDNFVFAREHRLDVHASRAATLLALLSLQEEDLPSADVWHARALQSAGVVDEQVMADGVKAISARIGIPKGDFRPAEDYLSQVNRPAQQARFRYRLTRAAIRCQVSLAKNIEPDREELDRMAHDLELHGSRGASDYFAATIYKGMVAIGEGARASAILQRYVTIQRRDRGPLPPSVTAAIQRIAAPN